MEYIYKFYCADTLKLIEAIKGRFPTFLGVVTSNPEKLGTTIIRINYGIWDSDKRMLDEIVISHQPKGNSP